MQLPESVTSRYEVECELGRGGQGQAFRARERESGSVVVLKALDFLELTSWKEFELWQRDASVLRSLDHPALPKILGHYPEEVEGDSPDAVITVQEYIEGETLEDLLEQQDGGPLMDEAEAREFLLEMLATLEYLHGLNPPVIHRDIKPSNIIRRPNGGHALIDFGAAQARTALTGGSTFVGTNGYMPPEQLMGRAGPSSDLFALGATVIHLTTAIHPSNLTDETLAFRLDEVPGTDDFRHYLRRLTNPVPEKRYSTAERAREALESPDGALVLARDVMDGFEISRRAGGTAVIRLPRPPKTQVIAVFFGVVLFISVMVYVGDHVPLWASLMFGLYALWGLWGLKSLWNSGVLEIADDAIGYRALLRREKVWALDDVVEARSRPGNSVVTMGVMLQTRDGKQHGLADALDRRHADWLAETINAHIEERR